MVFIIFLLLIIPIIFLEAGNISVIIILKIAVKYLRQTILFYNIQRVFIIIIHFLIVIYAVEKQFFIFLVFNEIHITFIIFKFLFFQIKELIINGPINTIAFIN